MKIRDTVGFKETGRLIKETNIVQMCAILLDLKLIEEEAYYMKLEAYWILTNIAYECNES